MNAPLLPEVLIGLPRHEPELPLAAEGVQRTVWHSRFGAILIEVRGPVAYVNGKRVEPLAEIVRALAG